MSVVDIRGNTALKRKFQRLARGIKNRRPLMKRIGVKLLNEVSENFKREGHEGIPWTPLSPFTVARRRGGGGGAKILQDTGKLRKSFTEESNNQRTKVGTIVAYAENHEDGKGVPERKMLPSQEKTFEVAVAVTECYLKENINKAGLK